MQPSEERLQELEALCDDSTDERVRDYYFRAERALMAFPELLAAYRELAEALKSDGVFQVLAEIGLTRMWTDETVNYLMQATEKAYSLSRALRGEKE